MGILSRIKKETVSEPPIPENEKKYYQPDSYYTDTFPIAAISANGTYGKMKVITFDERKKTSRPSSRGLYIAEILLLEYCSYGTYPNPKNGYPGFWWFEYGIRNVGAYLRSLEERGYIRFLSPKESVSKLTIPQIKKILKQANLSITGKKQDLVQRLLDNVSDEFLSKHIKDRNYTLTELGKEELSDNGYVPYMHKLPEKTIDIKGFGPICNVWEVNRRLKPGENWREVVSSVERDRKKFLMSNR